MEEKSTGNGDCPSLHPSQGCQDTSIPLIFQREKLSWILKSGVEQGTGTQPTWTGTSIWTETLNEGRELLLASVYLSVKWGKEFLTHRLPRQELMETRCLAHGRKVLSHWFPALSPELERMEGVCGRL